MSPTLPFTRLRLALAPLLAAAGMACWPAAQAHHVWIEQDAQTATLYFGEFGANLREVSPGLLDRFARPRALRQHATGTIPVALTKTPRGFVAAARAEPGEALLAEEPGYPIAERRQGEQVTRSLYHPAARFSTGLHAQSPVLALDLVPLGRPAPGQVEVQAFYKGQPLAKAKVAVVTASGWGQEHRTGDDGRLQLSLPWRGTYVLEIAHTDSTPGERTGAHGSEPYDRASYVTALSFVLAEGLPALPAAPAAAPNKP